MSINWNIAFNKLMALLDDKDLGTYHTGSQFLKVVSRFSEELPSYTELMEELKAKGKSTTRRAYYKDILTQLSEQLRIQVYQAFGEAFKEQMNQDNHFYTDEPIPQQKTAKVEEYCVYIQSFSNSVLNVPQPKVEDDIWNAERIKKYLNKMDKAFEEGDYGYTVTLAYTCLEGIFKAFLDEKAPGNKEDYLIPMSKIVRSIISTQVSEDYPQNMIVLISTIANIVSEARNQFSDSHFDKISQASIAQLCRDSVNSIARYVFLFMK